MDKIYSRARLNFSKFNINSNFKKNHENKLKTQIIKFFIVGTLAVVVTIKILEGITPIVEDNCISKAKMIATNIANEQATIVMGRYKADDLCNIEKDKNGNITMINANVITVNEIISDVPIRIQEELNKKENCEFYIRMGTITGTKILSGVGPKIKIKMETTGNIDTELKSEFEEKGINQTLHKMYLEIKCHVVILTPFKTIEKEIINQVLLSESIIIGITPNTFFNID